METLFTLKQYAFHHLKDIYETREIDAICRILFSDILNYSMIQQITENNQPLSDDKLALYKDCIYQLQQNTPLQYVIGRTEFYGLQFQLNADTLIPRPETEELVQLISKSLKPNMNILDIGTGSGCIAISLASLCPKATVEAIDIAANALQCATENALLNNVKVTFRECDVLKFDTYPWGEYDIIVSNPPYICDKEKQDMNKNVLDFEPHRALFVPDHDPLLFYRQIAILAMQHLKPGGLLYFEINEAYGNETIKLLDSLGFIDCKLHKDIHGKNRMTIAQKQGNETTTSA